MNHILTRIRLVEAVDARIVVAVVHIHVIRCAMIYVKTVASQNVVVNAAIVVELLVTKVVEKVAVAHVERCAQAQW